MFVPLKERDSGVSEIIATIMLVSITLVITSAIWFWVQGFIPTTKARSPTASGYVDISDVEYGVVYVFIEDVSETIGIMDVIYFVNSPGGVNLMQGWLNDSAVYGKVYIDSNYDGILNDGDFFSFDANLVENATFGLTFKGEATIMDQKIIL